MKRFTDRAFGLSESRKIPLFITVAWLVLFALSFAAFGASEALGDGFARGLTHLVIFEMADGGVYRVGRLVYQLFWRSKGEAVAVADTSGGSRYGDPFVCCSCGLHAIFEARPRALHAPGSDYGSSGRAESSVVQNSLHRRLTPERSID